MRKKKKQCWITSADCLLLERRYNRIRQNICHPDGQNYLSGFWLNFSKLLWMLNSLFHVCMWRVNDNLISSIFIYCVFAMMSDFLHMKSGKTSFWVFDGMWYNKQDELQKLFWMLNSLFHVRMHVFIFNCSTSLLKCTDNLQRLLVLKHFPLCETHMLL